MPAQACSACSMNQASAKMPTRKNAGNCIFGRKTSRTSVALLHALCYSLPFLALGASLGAWLVIVLTHAAIDRYRLARYVVWAKEHLAPRRPPPLH